MITEERVLEDMRRDERQKTEFTRGFIPSTGSGRRKTGDLAEAIMALDLQEAPSYLLGPVAHDVRRITNPDLIDHVMAVQRGVWQEDFSSLAERLVHDLRNTPDLLSIYVAYMDGTPASSAWLYCDQRSLFASLGGGSTVPAYRKRGLYTALLAVRVQEARQRGARYLTVDASPMSRPIPERFGFQMLTMSYPCHWRP